jgi:hypothetical protein
MLGLGLLRQSVVSTDELQSNAALVLLCDNFFQLPAAQLLPGAVDSG